MVEQEGYTVWRGGGGGVLERQCPDVEVQHPRKGGTLMRRSKGPCSGVDVPT